MHRPSRASRSDGLAIARCTSAVRRRIDTQELAPDFADFGKYRLIVGAAAEKRFDVLLKLGTAPALFKAFLDVHRDGLQVDVRRLFNEMLQMGIAKAGLLGTSPVLWAQSHLKMMIRNRRRVFESWVKQVCDKQNPHLAEEDFADWIQWKAWRAPRFVHMQPSGNTHYDPETAWDREDESRTKTLLEGLSGLFVEFLEIGLDNAAGDAHVELAQKGVPQTSSHLEPATLTEAKRVLRPLRRYRSELKRAIATALVKTPNASDLELCRSIDEDGTAELDDKDRTLVGGYKDPKRKPKLETIISKVRRDMRNEGLL